MAEATGAKPARPVSRPMTLAATVGAAQAPVDADLPHPVIAPPTRPAPRVANAG